MIGWGAKLEQVASATRDLLQVGARHSAELRDVKEEVRALRATLDQLLLQMQRQQNDHAAGLAALLSAEVETEEEREQREKLEKEFEEFQMVMKRLEEV